MRYLVLVSLIGLASAGSDPVQYQAGTDVFDAAGDYDPEKSMRQRSDFVVKACYEFSDPISPERGDLGWTYTDMPKPVEEAARSIFDFEPPHFQVCAPVSTEVSSAWKSYRAKVAKVMNKNLKDTVTTDKHKQRKENASKYLYILGEH